MNICREFFEKVNFGSVNRFVFDETNNTYLSKTVQQSEAKELEELEFNSRWLDWQKSWKYSNQYTLEPLKGRVADAMRYFTFTVITTAISITGLMKTGMIASRLSLKTINPYY